MKGTIPNTTPAERKAVLRSWLYKLLARIETCDDAHATQSHLSGRVDLSIYFVEGE